MNLPLTQTNPVRNISYLSRSKNYKRTDRNESTDVLLRPEMVIYDEYIMFIYTSILNIPAYGYLRAIREEKAKKERYD